MDGSHAVVCTRCTRRYPVDAESAIVDFLPDMSGSRPLKDYADCWDDEALQDEIAAATAAPRGGSSGIFIKMPPLLRELDFDDKVAVDLGCGYGRTLIYSQRFGRPSISIGIDISRVMLSKARRYAMSYDAHPLLLRAAIDTLPLQADSVDIVYSSGVLLHVPKATARGAMREVARVLKVGGTGVFERTFVGWLDPDGIQTKLVTSLAGRWLRPAWVRTYRYGELRSVLAELGDFSAVEIIPESHKVVPTSLFHLSVGPWKRCAQRLNAKASNRLRLKRAFVTSWSVKVTK
jgi:SAM-dependent methyltransferase